MELYKCLITGYNVLITKTDGYRSLFPWSHINFSELCDCGGNCTQRASPPSLRLEDAGDGAAASGLYSIVVLAALQHACCYVRVRDALTSRDF